MADALGIRIVPLSVRFGDTEYIDRTTITATGTARAERPARPPRPHAPSVEELEREYLNGAANRVDLEFRQRQVDRLGDALRNLGGAARHWAGVMGIKETALDARDGQRLKRACADRHIGQCLSRGRADAAGPRFRCNDNRDQS